MFARAQTVSLYYTPHKNSPPAYICGSVRSRCIRYSNHYTQPSASSSSSSLTLPSPHLFSAKRPPPSAEWYKRARERTRAHKKRARAARLYNITISKSGRAGFWYWLVGVVLLSRPCARARARAFKKRGILEEPIEWPRTAQLISVIVQILYALRACAKILRRAHTNYDFYKSPRSSNKSRKKPNSIPPCRAAASCRLI